MRIGGDGGPIEAGEEVRGGDGAEGRPVFRVEGDGRLDLVGAAGDGVEGGAELAVGQLRRGLKLGREHGLARFGGDERREAGRAEGGETAAGSSCNAGCRGESKAGQFL